MGINIISKITGYALFAVSCYFSVKLFTQFAVSGIDKMAWSVAGIAFMTGEFVFAIVGIRMILHKKHGFACLFGALYIALYCVSLFGTLGFESASSTDAEKIAGLGDEKKMLMEKTLAKIDEEIVQSEKRASEFVKRTIMSKGYLPEMSRIDALKADREIKYRELMAYVPEGNGAQAFWEHLAMFAGSSDPEQVKFACFLLIAILLDLTGATLCVVGFRTFKSFVEQEPSEAEYFGYQVEGERETWGARETENKRDSWREKMAMMQELEEIEGQDTDTEPEPVRAKAGQETGQGQDSPVQGHEKTKPRMGFSLPGQDRTGQSKDMSKDNPEARYVRAAFLTRRKAGNFQARRYLAEKVGLSQKEADEIHTRLKDLGLVEVKESKTIPRMSEAEILEVLGKRRG